MLNRLFQFIKDWFRGDYLGGLRSSRWPQFRKAYIKDKCEACGKKGTLLNPLELHHIEPYSVNPARELDITNILTGCRRCHQLIYHLDNFKSWNINAHEDAKKLREKIEFRPK